jgi:AcrR family transcriptional regulator
MRTSTKAARPGRPQEASLDTSILGAALKELAEVGYERVSVEAVARRARTAKTSVYRRWPSKDALVLAAVAHVVRAAGAPDTDTGSLRSDLLAHARHLGAMLTPERVAVFAGLLLAIRSNDALAAMLHDELVHGEILALTRIVDRAVTRGELPRRPLPTARLYVLPGVVFTRLFVLDQPLDDRFAEQLIDDVLLPLLRTPKDQDTAARLPRSDSRPPKRSPHHRR